MSKMKLQKRHEQVLNQIKVLLTRSFSLVCSTSKGISATEALLIIRSDVLEMNRIFQQHHDLFLQPRVNLLALKWEPGLVQPPLNQIKDEVAMAHDINNSEIVSDPSVPLDSVVLPAPVVPAVAAAPVIKLEPQSSLEQTVNHASLRQDVMEDVMEDSEPEPFDNSSENVDDMIDFSHSHSLSSEDEAPQDLTTKGAKKPRLSPITLGSLTSNPKAEDPEENWKLKRPNGCHVCRKTIVEKHDQKSVKQEKRKAHMVRYHPERVFVCDCGTHIFQEADIPAHFDEHPSGTVNKLIQVPSCESCGMVFLSPSGRLSKSMNYYWVQKGDVKFIDNHVAMCCRKRRRVIIKCPSCKMKMPQKRRLRHYLEKHPEEVRQCNKCGDWVEADQCAVHERHKHRLPERRIEEEERKKNLRFEIFCSVCDKRVSVPEVEEEKEARKLHAQEAHSGDVLKCGCGEYIWTDSEKDRHLQDHPATTQQPVRDLVGLTACPTCDMKFIDDQGNLTKTTRHFVFTKKDENFAKSHADQCQVDARFRQPTKCCRCEVVTRRFMLLAHSLENHTKLIRKCEQCHYWLPKWNIYGHRLKYHAAGKKEKSTANVEKEEFFNVCPHCGKVFNLKKKYVNHVKKHERLKREAEEQPVVPCSFCGQKLKKSEISQHEMGHIREGKVYNCSVCGKGLPYKTWVRHEVKCKKLATEGRPPKQTCPICHNLFADLSAHIARLHTERERYSCNLCGSSFTEIYNLRRHAMIHTKV